MSNANTESGQSQPDSFHTTPLEWSLVMALTSLGVTYQRATRLSIFIQQIHRELAVASHAHTDATDYRWVYKTPDDMLEMFPAWPSIHMVRRMMSTGKKHLILRTKRARGGSLYGIDYRNLDAVFRRARVEIPDSLIANRSDPDMPNIQLDLCGPSEASDES